MQGGPLCLCSRRPGAWWLMSSHEIRLKAEVRGGKGRKLGFSLLVLSQKPSESFKQVLLCLQFPGNPLGKGEVDVTECENPL